MTSPVQTPVTTAKSQVIEVRTLRQASPPGTITVDHVRKVFPYHSPDPNSNSDDMWVSYLQMLWGVWTKRGRDSKDGSDIVALDDVSLDVRAGEFLSVLGPNGAGKTTLVKVLASTLRPTTGRVIVNGYDVAHQPARARASLAVVMSAGWRALDSELTVRQNLVFWGRLYGLNPHVAEERALLALRVVGLDNWPDQLPGRLSSGMRQRLAIARGLLVRSPIFILDEPTVNIDPVGAYEIRDFLRNELNRGMGQTVVLTTHYMAEAEQLSDRVAIIDHGRVLACDSPAALIGRLGDCIVEFSVNRCSPEAIRALRARGLAVQIVDVLDSEGAGRVRIHLRPDAHAVAARDVLEASGVFVTEIASGVANLEDAFISLTGRKMD